MAKAKRKKRGRDEKILKDDREAEQMRGEGWTVDFVPERGELMITIDMDASGRPSKSGKMRLLASSGGWKKLGDVSFSFNVGRKV